MTDRVIPLRGCPVPDPFPLALLLLTVIRGQLHSALSSCPLQSLPSGGNLLPERSKLIATVLVFYNWISDIDWRTQAYLKGIYFHELLNYSTHPGFLCLCVNLVIINLRDNIPPSLLTGLKLCLYVNYLFFDWLTSEYQHSSHCCSLEQVISRFV